MCHLQWLCYKLPEGISLAEINGDIYTYIHIYIHTYIHIYVCVGFMTDLMFFRGDYDKPYEWETVLNRLVYNSIYNEIGKRGYF